MKVTKIKPAYVSGGGGEPDPPPPAEERMEVPAGGIIMYTGEIAPAGFTKENGLRFVMISGSTATNKTATAGSLVHHTHTSPASSEAGAHNHYMSGEGAGGGGGGPSYMDGYWDAISSPYHEHSTSLSETSTDGAHTHVLGDLPANSSVQAPYLVLNFIKNTSGGLAIAPVGSIVMFDGALSSAPDGWAICDGNNGTVDMRERFAYGTADNLNLLVAGGSKTHTHAKPAVTPAGAHAHSFTVYVGGESSDGGLAWGVGGGASNVTRSGHTHPVRNATTIEQTAHTHDISSPSEASHMPLYAYLYYIQRIS